MKTLPDYLNKKILILSIGLNPSLISVEKQYYFANPRNRFWTAFNKSKLVSEELQPSVESHKILLNKYHMGFTDVVKRPSSMGKDLKAADFKEWSPVLYSKIEEYNPKVCWFHGKVAANKFISSIGEKNRTVGWGMQNFRLNNSVVFVTPNPSPANAAYSLDVITKWYEKLARLKLDIKDSKHH